MTETHSKSRHPTEKKLPSMLCKRTLWVFF